MANRTLALVEEEEKVKKGPWTSEEDKRLISYISTHGQGRWDFLAKAAGLKRNGRSCRLRWVNYLRPNLNHAYITPEEERLIIHLHGLWGNRWSRIAENLPGRTDNAIKNYWRTRIIKKSRHQESCSGVHSNHFKDARKRSINSDIRYTWSKSSLRDGTPIPDCERAYGFGFKEANPYSLDGAQSEEGEANRYNLNGAQSGEGLVQDWMDGFHAYNITVDCVNSMALSELYAESGELCSDQLWNMDENIDQFIQLV